MQNNKSPYSVAGEGDWDDQMIFGRNGRRLFYLLACKCVGLVTAEDKNLAVMQDLG